MSRCNDEYRWCTAERLRCAEWRRYSCRSLVGRAFAASFLNFHRWEVQSRAIPRACCRPPLRSLHRLRPHSRSVASRRVLRWARGSQTLSCGLILRISHSVELTFTRRVTANVRAARMASFGISALPCRLLAACAAGTLSKSNPPEQWRMGTSSTTCWNGFARTGTSRSWKNPCEVNSRGRFPILVCRSDWLFSATGGSLSKERPNPSLRGASRLVLSAVDGGARILLQRDPAATARGRSSAAARGPSGFTVTGFDPGSACGEQEQSVGEPLCRLALVQDSTNLRLASREGRRAGCASGAVGPGNRFLRFSEGTDTSRRKVRIGIADCHSV